MVYGRYNCGNTRAFLNSISDWVPIMKQNGVTVIVGLFDSDTEQLVDMTNVYSEDIIFGMESSDWSEDFGLWSGLYACGFNDNSVTFPCIFLRNAEGMFCYWSTNYVNNPLTIVAAAIEMAGGNNSVAFGTPDFVLPANLTAIQAEAFSHTDATVVKLPEGVISIGENAFAYCTKLKQIYIPKSTTSIHPTAFTGVTGLTIFGKAGSAAEQFASDYGFTFVNK